MEKLEKEIYEYLALFTDDEFHEVSFAKFGLSTFVETAANNLADSGHIEILLQDGGVFIDMHKTNAEPESLPLFILARVLIRPN